MHIYTFAQKYFLTVLLFAGTAFASTAQNYTLIDGKVAIGSPANHTEESFATLHIRNNTSNTLQLNWTLLENDFTEDNWENISFCDPYICHYDIPASFSPTLPANETGVLKLGAIPKTNASVAKISIALWEEGANTKDTITLTLDARTLGIEGCYKSNIEPTFTIYPNPAKNILNLDIATFSNNKVEIYTLKGQKIFSSCFTGAAKSVNIETLPAGFYMLRLQDGNGNVRMNKFSKQ